MSNLLEIMFPDARRKQLENQIKREELSAMKKRSSAVKELSGLLSNQPTGAVSGQAWSAPDVMRPDANLETPAGQQRLMGLLSQINPEAVATGLLSDKSPRTSTDIPTMRELGYPIDQQGYEAFKRASQTSDPAQTLELNKLNLEVARLLREFEDEGETQLQGEQLATYTAKSMLKDGLSMLRIIDDLEGTAMETGVPLPEFRQAMASGIDSVLALFGENPAVGREIRTKYDLLKKGIGRFAASEAARKGANTDQSRASILTYMPSVDMTTDANRNVIATMMNDIIKESQIMGFEFDSSPYLPSIEKALKPSSLSVEMIPGFDGWSTADKQRARAEWLRMTPNQRAAFVNGG